MRDQLNSPIFKGSLVAYPSMSTRSTGHVLYGRVIGINSSGWLEIKRCEQGTTKIWKNARGVTRRANSVLVIFPLEAHD